MKELIDNNYWDIKLTDDIMFFDRTLSYELTGYRPIDMENGLDFKLEPFIEDALTKERTGKYTEFPAGTKAYADFWDERYRRCIEGYEYGGYRITGDNYFFINFYRLISAKSENGDEAFPTFTNVQYEWFHYVEMCERVKLDCVALKPRGIGWSEIAASLGVRPFITNERKTMFYTAYKEDFLTALLDKCWTQLDWLNMETDGGFKKLRQVKNTQFHKRASKMTKDRTEFGWMSEIIGVVADVPRKVRGFRSFRLLYEEFGSNPISKTSWVQGEALITRGGRRMGTRFGWGTGGDSGPALQGLSDIFNNPSAFKVLPYKHKYSASGEEVLTGFFIPAYRMHFDFLDDRGVTNEDKARAHFEKNRELVRTDPKAFIEYASEYCFTPEDALIRQGENQFNQALLANQLADMMIHKITPKPHTGFLSYKSPVDEAQGLVWKDDPNGDIIITEEPLKDENGLIYKNLYVAGIDSIDAGTQDSTGQKDVSDFCIVIKKRVHGMKEPQYVAMYKARPKDVRWAYANAFRLLEWYNCQAVLESTRISILAYAREKKKTHLLMRRPRATMADIHKGNTQMFGTPATETVIKHYLELIENFVNDHTHTIFIYEMLNQLLKYDYEQKRKFDIIAAMGMAELGDEEMYAAPVKSQNQYKKEWRDVGYFKDRTGKIHYGPIPSKDELETYHLYSHYDDNRSFF